MVSYHKTYIIPLRYDANCFGPERMQYLAVSSHRPCAGFFASIGLKCQPTRWVYIHWQTNRWISPYFLREPDYEYDWHGYQSHRHTHTHTYIHKHTDITYKLCRISWKTFHTTQTPYFSELIAHYLAPRSLCSSNTNLLAKPYGINSKFASWAFSASASSTWNSLPVHLCLIDKLSTFKRQLKSHLYQSAFAI